MRLRWLSDARPPAERDGLRVLCCGDRNWNDPQLVHDAFDSGQLWPLGAAWQYAPITIIHGGCRGADLIAAYVAKQRPARYAVEEYLADWKTHGKAAGPLRNQRMLDEERPDLVVAFHDYIDGSKGTRDMCSRALKVGLPVVVVSHDAPEAKPLEPLEDVIAERRAKLPRVGVAGMEEAQ